jgi:hypothetical protein
MSNPAYLSSLGQPPNMCGSATASRAVRKILAKLACEFTCQLLVEDLAGAIADNADTRRV